MDVKTVATCVGCTIALSSVIASVLHYVPLRPEIERGWANVRHSIRASRVLDSESEIRRREENICELESDTVGEYRLCIKIYERERDLRTQPDSQ